VAVNKSLPIEKEDESLQDVVFIFFYSKENIDIDIRAEL